MQFLRMDNLKFFATLGLFMCVTVAGTLLLERFGAFRKKQELTFDDSSNETSMINATSFPDVTVVKPVSNEHFEKCLKEHLKLNYYVFQDQFVPIHCDSREECLYNFLFDLGNIINSLNIKMHLIEPSILFCLLPSARKYNLLTRGFSSGDYKGSGNVITFGMQHSEAKLLDQVHVRKKLIKSGYRIWKFGGTMASAVNESIIDDIDASHYFIRKYDIGMHLVILYSKGTFMFSSAFNKNEISPSGLQYVDDRAFENWTSAAIYLNNLSNPPLLVPSDIRYFLLDVMTSKFIDCKVMSSQSVEPISTGIKKALKEVKAVLASQMVIFWLWSKSLQGWYEKCDIQYYSKALEVSVAAKSVEGYDFSALFSNSSCQHMEKYSNLTTNVREIELNCFGIPIHLIFTYEDKVTYWYEYIGDHHSYKLRFPKFTLCSTNVYGQKVTVPCEASEIFESEYGQFLKNRTLHLDPGSMKNVVLMSNV